MFSLFVGQHAASAARLDDVHVVQHLASRRWLQGTIQHRGRILELVVFLGRKSSFFLQFTNIVLVLVCQHTTTGKTTNGNDHVNLGIIGVDICW